MTGRELFDLVTTGMVRDGITPAYPTWDESPEDTRYFYDARARHMTEAHGVERMREALERQWESIGGRVAA